MPFSFPASPAIGATSTQNGRQYAWTGYAWELVAASGSGEDALLRSIFVPAAPTGLTATAGNGQVSLAWTAPTGVIAQAPITDYREQYSTDNGATWTTFTAAASTATSATVTGMTNGTAVRFRVAAVNAVGVGAYTAASAAVTPGLPMDALFSSVQLLLPGDTSTNDASSYSRSVTASNVTVSSAEKKFGAASLYFSGSSSHLSLADAAALELSNSDFALEFWMRTTNFTQYATLVSRSPSEFGSGAWSILMNSSSSTSGDIAFYAADIGSPILESSGVNLRDGSWHHVAVSRSSSNWSLYVDGARVGTGTSSATIANIAGGIRIGADEFYGRGYTGYIDDFRLTVGSSRSYTGSTITVPVAAFPTS